MSSWLDELNEEELEKLRAYKRGEQRPYDEADLLLADFALMYGWQAVQDFMSNKMSADFFLRLYKAGKHLQNMQSAQLLSDIRLGVNSAINGKKNNAIFTQVLRDRQKD